MTNKIDERSRPEVVPSDGNAEETDETASVQLLLQRMFDDAMSEIEALHQGWLVHSAAIAADQRNKRA